MSDKIAAKGTTRVILVLNMKRFIREEAARKRFETLRGSDAFARALHKSWKPALQSQSLFLPVAEDEMSATDVGFATGIFRSLMLRRLAVPTTMLDKSQVKFSDDLESNFQFKTLFKRAWDRWTISIRPTMTGFFIIRLTYAYQQSPRSLIDLAKDAIKLQEPLDVPSAVNWLRYNRDRYENEPDKLAEKERSVKALLEWLGADVDNPQASGILYYPVQWKLALEAINLYVNSAQFSIPHPEGDILIEPAQPSISLPLHDSYIVYHFDELFAEPGVIGRQPKGQAASAGKIPASLHDIRKSKQLRNALVNLLEGTVLRDPDKPDDELDTNGYFPSPRWSRADALITDNLASWNDELCLFTSRTALILPSKKWQPYEMAVSTVPGATLKVKYARYWEAVERMIEFVMEVRVLSQLIESDSYRLLERIADTVERIRADMFRGDIVISGDLKEQMAQAAHLNRVAALAQSIGHAQYWSRAEYAVEKAEKLFDLLDVPRILKHIERNIDSINGVADHVDELYLADLSEKSNEKTASLSNRLAAVSLILVLLALPSFWADWMAVNVTWSNDLLNDLLFMVFLVLGTFLGLGLAFGAIFLLVKAWWQRRAGKARG